MSIPSRGDRLGVRFFSLITEWIWYVPVNFSWHPDCAGHVDGNSLWQLREFSIKHQNAPSIMSINCLYSTPHTAINNTVPNFPMMTWSQTKEWMCRRQSWSLPWLSAYICRRPSTMSPCATDDEEMECLGDYYETHAIRALSCQTVTANMRSTSQLLLYNHGIYIHPWDAVIFAEPFSCARCCH